MVDWMPIETAPKDEYRLLLWFPTIHGGRAEFGRWDDDRFARRGPKPFWMGERPNDITTYRQNPPTHWARVQGPDA